MECPGNVGRENVGIPSVQARRFVVVRVSANRGVNTANLHARPYNQIFISGCFLTSLPFPFLLFLSHLFLPSCFPVFPPPRSPLRSTQVKYIEPDILYDVEKLRRFQRRLDALKPYLSHFSGSGVNRDKPELANRFADHWTFRWLRKKYELSVTTNASPLFCITLAPTCINEKRRRHVQPSQHLVSAAGDWSKNPATPPLGPVGPLHSRSRCPPSTSFSRSAAGSSRRRTLFMKSVGRRSADERSVTEGTGQLRRRTVRQRRVVRD